MRKELSRQIRKRATEQAPHTTAQRVGLAGAVLIYIYTKTLKVLHRKVRPLAPTTSVVYLALENSESKFPLTTTCGTDSQMKEREKQINNIKIRKDNLYQCSPKNYIIKQNK